MNQLLSLLLEQSRNDGIDLQELRRMLVNRVLVVGAIFAIPGFIAAVLGATMLGMTALTAVGIFGPALIGLLALLRNRLPYRVLACSLIGIIMLIAVMEFAGWGLSGVGSAYMLIGVFAAYIMIGRRFSIVMAAFSVAVVACQIIAIELGYRFTLDFQQYAYSREAWFAQLITVAILIGSLIAVLTFIFQYVRDRSNELSVHRNSLERTADILQSEIFEHDHTSRALAEALEHLQQIDQVKDTFVSNVSHELRTPIANLRLYMQLSQKRPDKAVEYIQTMSNEVQRLEKVVEQMLLMAKIQEGSDFGTWVHFDLQGIIKGVVEEFDNLISGRGMAIHFKEMDGMPQIFGSAGLIYQMIRSLMDNAVKYSPSGARIEIRSLTDAREGVSFVGFMITNTGVRIDQDEQRRIFERFYRGKSAMERNVPGAGLGLAAARQIAIIHHGTIRLQDSGSDQVSITVMLPSMPLQEAAGS